MGRLQAEVHFNLNCVLSGRLAQLNKYDDSKDSYKLEIAATLEDGNMKTAERTQDVVRNQILVFMES